MLLSKETIKKLTIVKKKRFSKTNVFIWNMSISFNKHALFNFKKKKKKKIPVCQNGKLLKKRSIVLI